MLSKSNWWPIFKFRDPLSDRRLNGQNDEKFATRGAKNDVNLIALITNPDDLENLSPSKLSKSSLLVHESSDGEIRSILPSSHSFMNVGESTNDAASYVTSKRTGIDPLLLVSIGK